MEGIIYTILLFFATYVMEDPATYWGIVLVEEGKLGFYTAWFAVAGGIFTGDLLLYILGRYGTGIRLIDNWTNRIFHRVSTNLWFRKINDSLRINSSYYILFARFMPGLRLPVYFLSGKNKIRVWQFSFITFSMAIGWVWLVFKGFDLGFSYLSTHWGLSPYELYILLFVCFILFLQVLKVIREPYWIKIHYYKVVAWTRWEFWPAWFFYAPLGVWIVYLIIRYRTWITALTAANPCFRYGGLSFDSKQEMLDVFLRHKKFIAGSVLIHSAELLEDRNISFPVIAKPDKGHRGDNVKLVHSKEELLAYASSMKRPFLLQEYIDYPFELGVFWLRLPWEKEGQIWSVTRKILPHLQGNGQNSLRELILSDTRARLVAETYLNAKVDNLEEVPNVGESIRLVNTGNHCKGAIFEDGMTDITGKTQFKLKEIFNSVPGFYFGRMDIKFQNEDSFHNGKGFKILEVNGAEAEATHIYDSRYSFWNAYRVLFAQWDILFQIAQYNIHRGERPVSAFKGLWLYARFFLFKK